LHSEAGSHVVQTACASPLRLAARRSLPKTVTQTRSVLICPVCGDVVVARGGCNPDTQTKSITLMDHWIALGGVILRGVTKNKEAPHDTATQIDRSTQPSHKHRKERVNGCRKFIPNQGRNERTNERRNERRNEQREGTKEDTKHRTSNGACSQSLTYSQSLTHSLTIHNSQPHTDDD